MSKHTDTALIGIGRWGRKIAGALEKASHLAAYASSGSQENIDWMTAHCSAARRATIEDICADASIKAAAIAAPIAAHAKIARALLDAGKHVFVEKPLGSSAAEAAALANLALERRVVLATGYVLLYHQVYRELKRRIDTPLIRKIVFRWSKFGTFNEPIELNLLTHHLSIALDWLGEPTHGQIQRGAGRVSACDAITARLHYRNLEVISDIDRHSDETSHTMSVELADGTRYLWEKNVLTGPDSGSPESRTLYRADSDALDAEIGAFVEAVEQPSSPLPNQGDFATRVLALLARLK